MNSTLNAAINTLETLENMIGIIYNIIMNYENDIIRNVNYIKNEWSREMEEIFTIEKATGGIF